MKHTQIVYIGLLLLCLEGGCIASHATLELAASSALRAGTTQLRTAHEEWAGDIDAADVGREADIIAAFAADVVRDADNPDAVARNKRAFAAALTKIRSDRDAAAERRRTASDNLDTIDEVADGLAQLARSSMNLDDEAQRYFGLWMKARDDAEKQRTAEQAARKAKRQAAIEQAVQAASGALFPTTSDTPAPTPGH